MFELIVAHDLMRGIAKNGRIPWHIREDLRFFREKTTGHAIIMGRNTFFSLPDAKPLVHRLNIVLTRTPELYSELEAQYPNLIFTSNDAFHLALDKHRALFAEYYHLHRRFSIFFIGGKEIYNQYASICDTLWITTVKKIYDCDVFIDVAGEANETTQLYAQYDEEVITDNEDIQIMSYTLQPFSDAQHRAAKRGPHPQTR